MSISVLLTLYSVKKCLIDALSVLFELQIPRRPRLVPGFFPALRSTAAARWLLAEEHAIEDLDEAGPDDEVGKVRAAGTSLPVGALPA